MTAGLLTRSLRVLGMAALVSAATVPCARAEPITLISGELTVSWRQ
jgi:hypothetical protein